MRAPSMNCTRFGLPLDAAGDRVWSWCRMPGEALLIGIVIIAVAVAGSAAIAPGLASDRAGRTAGQRPVSRHRVDQLQCDIREPAAAALFPALDDARTMIVVSSAIVFVYAPSVIGVRVGSRSTRVPRVLRTISLSPRGPPRQTVRLNSCFAPLPATRSPCGSSCPWPPSASTRWPSVPSTASPGALVHRGSGFGPVAVTSRAGPSRRRGGRRRTSPPSSSTVARSERR